MEEAREAKAAVTESLNHAGYGRKVTVGFGSHQAGFPTTAAGISTNRQLRLALYFAEPNKS
jgi:hypothetical protein